MKFVMSVEKRSALFCDVTEHGGLIFTEVSEQCIGPIYKGQDVKQEKKVGKTVRSLYRDRCGQCPETSVKVYHSTLRNSPEERRSHQHRGGSLKS